MNKFPMRDVANQYRWHLERVRRRPLTPEDKPGGMLVAAIEHNKRPPMGHPDEAWFKRANPYQYLGEADKVWDAPKVRGGGRRARRTANKGSKTAAAIVPGGLHFGDKHGALGKEKRTHREKFGLKELKNE